MAVETCSRDPHQLQFMQAHQPLKLLGEQDVTVGGYAEAAAKDSSSRTPESAALRCGCDGIYVRQGLSSPPLALVSQRSIGGTRGRGSA